jgi:hypothetical protein
MCNDCLIKSFDNCEYYNHEESLNALDCDKGRVDNIGQEDLSCIL